MKKLLIVLSILISSCSSNIDELTEYKSITFATQSYEISSRTSVESAGMTDLWVLENGEILIHQSSTSSSFGSPTLNLSYGSHTLTFITSKSTDQIISNGIFSCSKVLDTFSKTLNINVTNNTPITQEITLQRIVYGISISIKDVLPNDIYDMEVIIKDHSLSYNPSTSYGTSAIYSRVFDLSKVAGKSPTSDYTIYGFMIEDKDNIDITLNFRREDESIIISREINDIPIKLNQKTYLKGYFFDSNQSLSLQVNTTWLDEINIDYNNR